MPHYSQKQISLFGSGGCTYELLKGSDIVRPKKEPHKLGKILTNNKQRWRSHAFFPHKPMSTDNSQLSQTLVTKEIRILSILWSKLSNMVKN